MHLLRVRLALGSSLLLGLGSLLLLFFLLLLPQLFLELLGRHRRLLLDGGRLLRLLDLALSLDLSGLLHSLVLAALLLGALLLLLGAPLVLGPLAVLCRQLLLHEPVVLAQVRVLEALDALANLGDAQPKVLHLGVLLPLIAHRLAPRLLGRLPEVVDGAGRLLLDRDEEDGAVLDPQALLPHSGGVEDLALVEHVVLLVLPRRLEADGPQVLVVVEHVPLVLDLPEGADADVTDLQGGGLLLELLLEVVPRALVRLGAGEPLHAPLLLVLLLEAQLLHHLLARREARAIGADEVVLQLWRRSRRALPVLGWGTLQLARPAQLHDVGPPVLGHLVLELCEVSLGGLAVP
mmetsp:Transcript_43387/g.106141  ORF Transcript_43387/g.106141 Transcript_43387/m.106141 type:complete len:349 (+) Transcript_43387:282-1328(+)